MKKLIVGLAAVGVVMALRPALKRRMVQKMRDHCGQMVSKCRETMGAQTGGRGEAGAMPEHCKEKAAQFKAHGEPSETREHPERKAQLFVVREEAVTAM